MDFERDQSVLGTWVVFPTAKRCSASLRARANIYLSLLLGSPRSRDQHPALLRLFRSLRITSRAGWAGLGCAGEYSIQ